MLVFDIPLPLVLGLLVSTVLPLLVGLVTTSNTKSGVKAVLLAALSAITGLVTEFAAAVDAGVAYNLGSGLVLALGAFLVGVGLHKGLYSPTTLSAKAQNVLITAKGEDGTHRVI